MAIVHAKVSGLTNPADPDLVGGEDWDADHVLDNCAAIVGASSIVLTTAGAISAQSERALSFSKTATGTYRALYDNTGWGLAEPSVHAYITTPSGAPVFTRTALGNNGTSDYVEVYTIDIDGALVNVAAGRIEVVAFGFF